MSQHTTNNLTVNIEYKYEDVDISSILNLRLQQENLTGCSGIFTIAPIAEQEGKLIEFLSEEKQKHQQWPNRTLLLPYLKGCHKDGHWVGIVVKFQGNVIQKVEYYDSLSHPVAKNLEADMKEIYGSDIAILHPKPNAIDQNDSSSCGPCMIENLVYAVKQNRRNMRSIQEVRRHHIELMNQNDPKKNFYEKQRQNQISLYKNKNPKVETESHTEIVLKCNDRPNHIHQESKSQTDDLNYLQGIKTIAQRCIDIHLNNTQILCNKLAEIGELVDKIKRNESDTKLLRNVHGYRNASSSNKKNTKGAKLDFTALSYLKFVTKKHEFKQQLKHIERIKDSLNVLIQKIDYILRNDGCDLNDSHDSDLGFLWKIICYYHDLDCLGKLLGTLDRIGKTWYRELKLNFRIDRYALGYFFVEFGETAKEFSDFIQPENVGKDNLIRGLLCALKEFRNIPKTKPDVIRIARNYELFQMKVIIKKVKRDLKLFLSDLNEKLTKFFDLNEYHNFYEFDKPESKLSVFEQENEHLIKPIKEIISPIKKNNLAKHITELQNQISNCNKVLGNNPSNASEDQIREMALADSLKDTKKLLQINSQMIHLTHLINTPQLDLFTEEQTQLILAIKNVIKKCHTIDEKSANKLSEDQKSLIRKLHKQGQQNVEEKNATDDQMNKLKKHLDKYLKVLKDIPEINEIETIDLIFERTIFENRAELHHSYVEKARIKIKTYDLEKCMLEKSLCGLEKIQTEVENYKDEYPYANDKHLNKRDIFSQIVFEIIDEIEFSQSIPTELAKPGCKLYKFISAAKMSLGFIGSLFLNFERACKCKTKKLILEKSPLLGDLMRVVKVRHNEIMHNATHSTFTAHDMTNIIKNYVSPWLKDFIAMFMYITLHQESSNYIATSNSRHDFVSAFEPILRIEWELTHHLALEHVIKLIMNSNESRIDVNIVRFLYAFTDMIVCSRLFKYKDIIQIYNDRVKSILLKINLPEISIAIYYEVGVAHKNLEEFEKSAKFLELALKKLQTITNCKYFHHIKSAIHIHIGIASHHMGNSLKAKTCFDEGSILNEPYFMATKDFLLASVEVQKDNYKLKKSQMELNFVKHFDEMRARFPHLAINVLRSLACFYLVEFDVKGAEETLNLLDNIFNEYRFEIISAEGQRIATHEIETLLVRTKYDICQAIISSSEQECTAKLKQIYSALSNLKSSPENDTNPRLDSYLLHVAILLKKPFETTEINAEKIDRSYETSFIRGMLILMNITIFKFQHRSTVEAISTYKIWLDNIKDKIMGAFQKLAILEYYEKNFDRASFLMRRAYLCNSLEDYLKFNLEEFILRGEMQMIGIARILFPIEKISDADLIQIMRQRFSSECNSPENNTIRQYMEAKGDRKLIQKLIKECEEKVTIWEKICEKYHSERNDEDYGISLDDILNRMVTEMMNTFNKNDDVKRNALEKLSECLNDFLKL